MTIKVLVVDDSFFMRRMISDILNADPEVEVIATAKDGKDALDRLKSVSPDVITLDLYMPELDGLATLKHIMKDSPRPVVMVSAHTAKGAEITLDCLAAGAVGFVLKPSGEISWDIGEVKHLLIDEIKSAAKVSVRKIKALLTKKPHRLAVSPGAVVKEKVVAIGASTGGPQALELVLSELPFNFPAGILVVQHLPAQFTASLAKRLDRLCDIAVKEAEDNELVEAGKVYIAPGDYHMMVEKKSVKGRIRGIISLNKNPEVKHLRPSVDVMMDSVADAYGKNVIGVILSGMGDDGTEGMKAIKSKGGTTIAQDENTSLIYGMPKRVIENGDADHVLPLPQISRKMLQLI